MTDALRYISIGAACTALFASPFYTYADTLSKPPNNLGLLGYWSFNEASGTLAGDFSGNGNTGTLTGDPTWISGKRGTALRFSADHVEVPEGNLDITGAITIAFWLRVDVAPGDFEALVAKRDDPCGPDTYSAEIHPNANGTNRMYFFWTIGGCEFAAYTSDAAHPFRLGIWDHWVLVRNAAGTAVQMYRNGEDAGASDATGEEISGTAEASDDPVSFGDFSYGGGEMDGAMDDIRIYNRALGATEAAKLYASGAARALSSSADLDNGSSLESGLIGHWTMDGKDTTWVSDTVGTTSDKSGGGTHGGLINMNRRSSVDGGALGQAIVFDGSDDRVNLGDPTFLDGATQATFCTWLRYTPASVITDGTLISKYSTAGHSFLFWVDNVNSGTIAFFAGLDSSGRVTGTSNLITSGVWDHYCVTFQGGSSLRLYKNGVFNAQQTTNVSASIPNTSTSMLFGDDGNLGRKLNGLMDDVRIYTRILTDSELKQLYQLGQAKIRP